MIENMFKNLSAKDKHLFRAVMGWLDLNDYDEALKELDSMSASVQSCPEILDVRWQICARRLDWSQSLTIARSFAKQHPKIASAWIHQSYSLHELGRTIEAREQLMNAHAKFPQNALIVYNLACYCCQLNDHEMALQWIQEAMALREKSEILSMALEDKDLEPIRDRLAKLVA